MDNNLLTVLKLIATFVTLCAFVFILVQNWYVATLLWCLVATILWAILALEHLK